MKYSVLLMQVLALAWIQVVCASSSGQDNADFILYNGKIITVDSLDNIFSAIAIREGKIIRLGSDEEIRSLAGPGCRFINLNGKTATPGLVDSHYHVMYYGQQFGPGLLNIRHPEVKSKADLLRVLGDYVKLLKKDEWISGNQGFHIRMNETLDRTDIDKVAPENPAYLRHGSGQYAVVNSRALEIAGITNKTPNPPSSVIGRDSLGNPNGILSHYPAENLVARYATGYGDRSDQQKTEDIDRGQKLCLEAGYTSVQDVIVGTTNDIRLYQEYARSGKLKVRLYTMLYLHTEEMVNDMALTYRPESVGLFVFGGWKLAMDGGPAPKTVLMYDTTIHMAQASYPYFSQDELNRMVSTLHNTGLQVAVHVSGDRGIDMTLTAFEEAMRKNPRNDPRHRIEHGIWPSDSALKRMQKSKIILSTQPQWISWHGDVYIGESDPKTMEHFLPLKTMNTMGIPLAFGCDVPASLYQEPRYAFAGSVFRKTPEGTVLNPEEKLTVQEALRIHTLGSAYAGFADKMTGSLVPGKYADIVVWTHDLYTMKPADLTDLKPVMTMVNGEVVYNSGALVHAGNSEMYEVHDPLTVFPNPCSGDATIHFEISGPGKILICIINELGQKVRTIADGTFNSGEHTLVWNSTDDTGENVPPGLYFIILQTNNSFQREKIIISER
jgi:predicted amidohydrolase YtcJ